MVVVRSSYKKFHKHFPFLFVTVFFSKEHRVRTHTSFYRGTTHRTKKYYICISKYQKQIGIGTIVLVSSAFTAPLEIKETHKNDKSRTWLQYGPHTKNIFFMHCLTLLKNSTFLSWFLPKIMVSVLANAHTKYASVFVEKRLFFQRRAYAYWGTFKKVERFDFLAHPFFTHNKQVTKETIILSPILLQKKNVVVFLVYLSHIIFFSFSSSFCFVLKTLHYKLIYYEFCKRQNTFFVVSVFSFGDFIEYKKNLLKRYYSMKKACMKLTKSEGGGENTSYVSNRRVVSLSLILN